MTPMYKTAYPYYSEKKKLSMEVITREYRLTHEEIQYIKNRKFDDINFQLCYAVLLIIFKNLNYFPELDIIPSSIIDYIKDQLQIPTANFVTTHSSTISRYKKLIYKYYNTTPWKPEKRSQGQGGISKSEKFIKDVAIEASQLHNYPADIINIVVEQCKKQCFELPTFKQLDRMVRHAKEVVNQKLFEVTYNSLSDLQIHRLDELLEITDDYKRSNYNDLKSLPKNPTITNFRDLLKHHLWLESFGDIENHIGHIIPLKLKQFAEQARILNAGDLKKDFSKAKRYALILSLVAHAKSKAKDGLAITYYKTIFGMHKKAKNKLEELREHYRTRTQELLVAFSGVLGVVKESNKSEEGSSGHDIITKIDEHGGAETLKSDCDEAISLNSNNHLTFLLKPYANKRGTLLQLLETLDLQSSTQENILIKAIEKILKNSGKRSEYIHCDIDLSFTTEQWRKMILKKDGEKTMTHRHYLELCVLSHVADELRSKDLFIIGADSYADYRSELLPKDECKKLLDEYCNKVGIANNGKSCVEALKKSLIDKANTVDESYPSNTEFTIDESGTPILHKRGPKKKPETAIWLEKILKQRMNKRNLLDVLCSSHFYCGWADELGPMTGNDPKIKNPIERYLLTTFAFGSGLGPTQTMLHVRSQITAKMLSWANQRHVTPDMLDRARERLINLMTKFDLPKTWGDGSSVAADGTMQELREQNLIAEFHFRYRKKGGIAYHHVADNYILLFSTFMPCGVWEAVEIIEGLLKNNSDIQPSIIHGDTQAQSTVVFALAYLLGFRLMPRIRNWHDLKMFRPDKNERYKNIDNLFTDTIDWDIIKKHWEDMMQVVLSIRNGSLSSSKLLRKLSNYSRKNRLYQAFQELGYVIRTLFLLNYISDVELRETITEQTNKVEAYNALSDWCAFGSNVLVASNDDIEMEKAVKYNDILANAVMLQNISDKTEIIAELLDEGYSITKEDMSYLCPYWVEHLKRFGNMRLDFDNIPKSVENNRRKVLW